MTKNGVASKKWFLNLLVWSIFYPPFGHRGCRPRNHWLALWLHRQISQYSTKIHAWKKNKNTFKKSNTARSGKSKKKCTEKKNTASTIIKFKRIFHCYHVNDCSSKTLVIKGGVHFLRHCWPFITDLNFANKRRMAFFSVQKCRPPFTNKNFC